jgi:hypothetical protein
MNYFFLDSNFAHIHIGPFYIGWNNVPHHPVNDCGDETFGISVKNYYIGCYSDGKWYRGFLDENGCLPE